MKPLICHIACIAIPDQVLALTQDVVTISNKKKFTSSKVVLLCHKCVLLVSDFRVSFCLYKSMNFPRGFFAVMASTSPLPPPPLYSIWCSFSDWWKVAGTVISLYYNVSFSVYMPFVWNPLIYFFMCLYNTQFVKVNPFICLQNSH